MAFRRALVVDDSKTARQSLARLLAEYDMEVAFADCGEAALDFLHHELVDVIFMDHTMPGMDGLEAVSAIKSNPRTATIPVMMYTTKEGEVYVSQARALGAVGVLPKQFHPNVLFEMLQKLGLVTDRRTGEAPAEEPAPRRRITDLADEEVDSVYEQRALGVSVQTLMQRILEEQHLKLRAEILSGQKRFAREVAEEILQHHAAGAADTAADEDAADENPAFESRHPVLANGIVTVLGLAVIALLVFGWQMTRQRDAALLEVARLDAAARNELDALSRRNAGLDDAVRQQTQTARERGEAAARALAWALNQNMTVPFDALPFDDAAADRLAALLDHLSAMDFRGTLSVTAELAPFCLTDDPIPRLAPPDSAIEDCPLLASALGESATLGGLQSVAFATAIADARAASGVTVRLGLRALHRDDAGRFPGDLGSAGEWNRQAAVWNRLTFGLEPRGAGAELATRDEPGGR